MQQRAITRFGQVAGQYHSDRFLLVFETTNTRLHDQHRPFDIAFHILSKFNS